MRMTCRKKKDNVAKSVMRLCGTVRSFRTALPSRVVTNLARLTSPSCLPFQRDGRFRGKRARPARAAGLGVPSPPRIAPCFASDPAGRRIFSAYAYTPSGRGPAQSVSPDGVPLAFAAESALPHEVPFSLATTAGCAPRGGRPGSHESHVCRCVARLATRRFTSKASQPMGTDPASPLRNC